MEETWKIGAGAAVGVAALALLLRLYGPNMSKIGSWFKSFFVKVSTEPTRDEAVKAYDVLRAYCKTNEAATEALRDNVWNALESGGAP